MKKIIFLVTLLFCSHFERGITNTFLKNGQNTLKILLKLSVAYLAWKHQDKIAWWTAAIVLAGKKIIQG
jgi:hypothetical protein